MMDVWFLDDGRWRLELASVNSSEAEAARVDLVAAGYEVRILPAGADSPGSPWAR